MDSYETNYNRGFPPVTGYDYIIYAHLSILIFLTRCEK